MFQVITDTSANLPSELAQRNDITVIPFPYFVNGAPHTCLDTEGFDGQTFYGTMREGAEVTTSQINPQRYLDVMKPILRKGLDILFVGMSSGISGSFHCAELAAEGLSKRGILLGASFFASNLMFLSYYSRINLVLVSC